MATSQFPSVCPVAGMVSVLSSIWQTLHSVCLEPAAVQVASTSTRNALSVCPVAVVITSVVFPQIEQVFTVIPSLVQVASVEEVI